jgi:molecular chaperone DnaJ
MKDLYETLGLPWGADEAQIRKAYRRLARACHPDVSPDDPQAAERFKEISAAYRMLSDSKFKDFFTQRREDAKAENKFEQPGPEVSRDIHVRLYVTLEELDSGVSRKIRVKRRGLCPTCSGQRHTGGSCPACRGTGHLPDLLHPASGRMIPCRKCNGSGLLNPSPCSLCSGTGSLFSESTVTVGVPPGAQDQSQILVKSQGHDGTPGNPVGDLKVTVCIKEHPYLIRQDCDLIYRCRISLSQWLNGTDLRVPSLEGPLTLKLDPGSKPEGVLRVRRRGLPGPDGVRGNLLVQYRLCVPETLNRKQIALLIKLENSPGFIPELDEKGFNPRPAV